MQKMSRSAHRKLATILALLAVLLFAATPAFAARPHFRSDVTLTTVSTSTTQTALAQQATRATLHGDSSGSPILLAADGKLVGIDGLAVKVKMRSTGVATVICEDHHYGTPQPHSVPVTAEGSVSLSPPYDHGRASFRVVTGEPVAAHSAGCESHYGSDHDDDFTITSVAWSSVDLTLENSVTHATLDDLALDKCKTKGNKVKCQPHGHDDD